MTVQFLKYKVQEYERLRAEIEELQREAKNSHEARKILPPSAGTRQNSQIAKSSPVGGSIGAIACTRSGHACLEAAHIATSR